mgnify:FL=1
MQENNNSDMPVEFEDIRSSSGTGSQKAVRKVKESAELYGSGIFKHLGNIIKAISFMVSFGILGIALFVGYFLYSKDHTAVVISLCIVIAGLVFAMITMFLIFGLGHVICQNNEIMKRLKRLEHDYY